MLQKDPRVSGGGLLGLFGFEEAFNVLVVADGLDPDGAVAPKEDDAEGSVGAEFVDVALKFSEAEAGVLVRVAECQGDLAESGDDLGALVGRKI